MNQLPRESGTAMRDVPHQFKEAAGGDCVRCGRTKADAVHTSWQAMNAASRESASSQVPRVHG